jgi:hypothetical protein
MMVFSEAWGQVMRRRDFMKAFAGLAGYLSVAAAEQ